ncbi:hypothetical protein A2774_01530 [Candidatus Roizmanbacteria bacterium RIFCSPHIGHO2_01_FULL_39_12c]|uniref:Phosphatidic acid phosphatase type 2/haloperoxidase domain-containing protein n=1 Tax=Candidatus Roizmanbacteria bacterium RIFCSPHIGHO2_01_FULL_39_12c TaxID=1802031 RepID=A0A1F7G873_9BACT|nr:MAG: hypothetical protein A2774_01530 [Candidatus Roizmanbacteria bacterium RIFCSPHIGHO2_01_FULL_39_12c]OGK46586.1 MAG: hypothetical protein A2963_02535 [Candidatus Roizmanbacteria bacterium RIFCSPLOWO2_01_FULL_40_13]
MTRLNLIAVDLSITQLLNKILPHSILVDHFFSFLSLRGASILVWIIVIAIILILEERKYPGIQKQDIKFIFVFLLAFTVSYITSDAILKNVFQRPRPASTNFNQFQPISANCPKDNSFPSTHATTAFAAATVLTYFDKKRRWFYYLVAILISLSRIYLGCHFFFDVLTGGIIGWIISKLIISQLRRI